MCVHMHAWVPMCVHGCPCVFMVAHVCLFMGAHGVWVHVCVRSCVCACMHVCMGGMELHVPVSTVQL